MDFLSSLAKGGDHQPKPTSDQPNNPDHKPASNSDLLASARLVADAAQAQFRNEPEKYDKNKVAGAAADLLQAASDYGKLDETKGAGKYIDQAESYLRKYGTSSPSAAGEHKPAADAETAPAKESAESEKPSGGGGDYLKMAEGLLNKPSTAGEKSESGYGDLMKMAGGFLNK
ncbi:nodulin-related protein 1 [Striga hermonthica]|uniref:Nodulin-related protein 1 n=1 Tax=Striga hermonthica TaxID=68872 RepID=A0A9N7NFJ0_STRHE|nr:nodulin-related protein 1 [Striga hermonthica]